MRILINVSTSSEIKSKFASTPAEAPSQDNIKRVQVQCSQPGHNKGEGRGNVTARCRGDVM